VSRVRRSGLTLAVAHPEKRSANTNSDRVRLLFRRRGDLAVSWRLDVDAVPTLIRILDGVEVARTAGWDRERWEHLTELDGLGPDLPVFKPG